LPKYLRGNDITKAAEDTDGAQKDWLKGTAWQNFERNTEKTGMGQKCHSGVGMTNERLTDLKSQRRDGWPRDNPAQKASRVMTSRKSQNDRQFCCSREHSVVRECTDQLSVVDVDA
jgi:hypothetical protein